MFLQKLTFSILLLSLGFCADDQRTKIRNKRGIRQAALVQCTSMPQITVTVVRADTNQEYEVELPDDAKLDDLLPQLVQQLGLPLVGPDGNRISYQLSNKRTSQELKQNKTLGEYATKHGDLLLLTSTFVAGN